MERIVCSHENLKSTAPDTICPGDLHGLGQKDRLTKAPPGAAWTCRTATRPSSHPMNLEEKLAFYRFLLELGFKEIEVVSRRLGDRV